MQRAACSPAKICGFHIFPARFSCLVFAFSVSPASAAPFSEKPQAAKPFFFLHLLSNGKVFVKILLRNVYTSCKKYCIIRAEVMYDIT